jgi:hypothetical protein
MAEPRAEKRGTLRGPPSFRVMDNGRQWRRASHELCGAPPDDVVGSQQGRRTYAALRTSSHHGRIRFADIDRRPLAAARAKEKLMHNPHDPSRIENSHPNKTPGERVHDWRGRVHDATTNSPSPMRDGSAETAKNQLRGFMIPGRGVHDCRTAAVSASPVQIELYAAPLSVRTPAPSMRRTSGEPTAAERRPERRALLRIALRAPSRTWWGRYSVASFSQHTLDITGASCPRRPRLYGICPPHPDRTGEKDGEPVGLTVSPPRATIMKVAARHEAESKIDVQYYWTWRRCRWPTQWACPRALLEVAALGEKA